MAIQAGNTITASEIEGKGKLTFTGTDGTVNLGAKPTAGAPWLKFDNDSGSIIGAAAAVLASMSTTPSNVSEYGNQGSLTFPVINTDNGNAITNFIFKWGRHSYSDLWIDGMPNWTNDPYDSRRYLKFETPFPTICLAVHGQHIGDQALVFGVQHPMLTDKALIWLADQLAMDSNLNEVNNGWTILWFAYGY